MLAQSRPLKGLGKLYSTVGFYPSSRQIKEMVFDELDGHTNAPKNDKEWTDLLDKSFMTAVSIQYLMGYRSKTNAGN